MGLNKYYPTISCILYLILLQIYYVQDILGLAAVGKYILAGLVVYSLYKTVYTVFKYKLDPMMKMLFVLLVVFTIYGVYNYIWGPVRYFRFDWGGVAKADNLSFLKQIMASLPMVFVYYDFAKKGVFTPRVLDIITGILIFFSFIAFIQFYISWGSDQYMDGVQNNQGYKFARLIPLIFLLRRWRMALILLCYFFVIVSIKRGAIFTGTISVILYFFLWMKKARGWKKTIALFGISLISIGGLVGIKYFYDNSPGFQSRVEKTLNGDNSGRSTLSDDIWEKIEAEDDYTVLWFGRGADTTVDYAGNYAHNDWLEILANQGIFSIILYALFFLTWLMAYFKMRKWVLPATSMAFLACFLTSLACSVFSMGYTSLGGIAAILIAVCLSRYELARRTRKKEE